MEAILDGLPQPIKENIGQCISAKDLCVKLEKLYPVEQKGEEKTDILEVDSEDEENLFMGTVTLEDDSYMEGEVALKVELISALEELRKSRMKNNSLKEKLSKYLEEQKSKEEEFNTLQEELHNSR